MENQGQNVQAQTSPSTDAKVDVKPQGPSVEDRLAELERANKGLIGELQKEREKRHTLEAQITSTATTQPDANPQVQPGQAVVDEVGRVVNPYVEPVAKSVSALELKFEKEQAINVLAEKSGKRAFEIRNDTDFLKQLDDVTNKYSIGGSLSQRANAAYDIWKMQQGQQQNNEATRTEVVSQQSPLQQGTQPVSGSGAFVMSSEEFTKMDPKRYTEYESKGSFRKDGDKFVFTPNT
jgi:hypothetical protein